MKDEGENIVIKGLPGTSVNITKNTATARYFIIGVLSRGVQNITASSSDNAKVSITEDKTHSAEHDIPAGTEIKYYRVSVAESAKGIAIKFADDNHPDVMATVNINEDEEKVFLESLKRMSISVEIWYDGSKYRGSELHYGETLSVPDFELIDLIGDKEWKPLSDIVIPGIWGIRKILIYHGGRGGGDVYYRDPETKKEYFFGKIVVTHR